MLLLLLSQPFTHTILTTTTILLVGTCPSSLEGLQSLKELILGCIDQFKEGCASLSTNKSVQDLQDSLWIEIRNRSPKVAHVDAQLPSKLKDFRVLSTCVKDVDGDDLRAIELAIQENPKDVAAQKQLSERSNSMMLKYAEEIEGRVNSPELTWTVVEICHLGNDSFRKVYCGGVCLVWVLVVMLCCWLTRDVMGVTVFF